MVSVIILKQPTKGLIQKLALDINIDDDDDDAKEHLPNDTGGSERNGTKSLMRLWLKMARTKGSGRSRFYLSAISQILCTKLSSMDVPTSVCYYETC